MAHRWLDRQKGDGRLRVSLWAPNEKSDEVVYHIHVVNLYAGKRNRAKNQGVKNSMHACGCAQLLRLRRGR